MARVRCRKASISEPASRFDFWVVRSVCFRFIRSLMVYFSSFQLLVCGRLDGWDGSLAPARVAGIPMEPKFMTSVSLEPVNMDLARNTVQTVQPSITLRHPVD